LRSVEEECLIRLAFVFGLFEAAAKIYAAAFFTSA